MCCGSLVIKRKQSLSDEKAAKAPGVVVDLIAKKMETFGLGLMMKRVNSITKKKIYLCADGDTQVNTKKHKLRAIHYINRMLYDTQSESYDIGFAPKLSPTRFVSNIRHQHPDHYLKIINNTFCLQHPSPISKITYDVIMTSFKSTLSQQVFIVS